MEPKIGHRIPKVCALALIFTATWSSGCSVLWREGPIQVNTDSSKLKMDASWFLENPSKDLIQRVSDDRQAHITHVLGNREKGVISVSLHEALTGETESIEHHDPLSDGSTASESHSVENLNPESATDKRGSGRLMIKLKGET